MSDSVISRRPTGVVIDTNLLVVFVTGLVDPNLIGRTKRTKAYAPEDFDLLNRLLSAFPVQVTFPNIMTEVSNLIEKSDSHFRFEIAQRLHSLSGLLTERYYATAELSPAPDLVMLGVTDQVILTCVTEKLVLLSDDFELGRKYQAHGGELLNFNHIRETAYL